MKTVFKYGLLSFLMLLSSCGTRKATYEEHRNVRLEEMTEIKSTRITGVQINDSLGIHFNRETLYKITRLSQPDSMGNQYPLSIEEGKITEEYREDEKVTSELQSAYAVEEEKNVTFTDKSKIQSEEKKDNRPIPAWVWYILGAVFMILIIGKLKSIIDFIRKIFCS